MTNEEMIQDLKQFITATVSQEVAGVRDDIKDLKSDVGNLQSDVSGIKADVARLDEKTDAVQDAIAETVTQVADSAEASVREHEGRYHGRLKHRTA